MNIDFPVFSESAFDDVYYDILSYDRRLCAVIYDVVKQVPEFARITTLTQNQRLTQELLQYAEQFRTLPYNNLRLRGITEVRTPFDEKLLEKVFGR